MGYIKIVNLKCGVFVHIKEGSCAVPGVYQIWKGDEGMGYKFEGGMRSAWGISKS